MSESPPLERGEERFIPLSAVNQFLYCPRRAALIHVEGIFEDNVHTIRGDIVHEHTDLAGYESHIADSGSKITLLRALPVFSDRLGLNGKCDVVEVRSANSKLEISDLRLGAAELRPVEFKVGKRRQWENDDAQLCAQALCLEEMFQTKIERGAIFHAASKRRREVEFTPELRQRTEEAVAELRRLLEANSVPAAIFKPACEECSLFEICLPKITAKPAAVERAAKLLFEI
jgi:CRISPR-associated exonuclease Cas4